MYITIPGIGGSYEILHISVGFGDVTPGYYWQACWPGCLPDGDLIGPYADENAAIMACQDFVMSDA